MKPYISFIHLCDQFIHWKDLDKPVPITSLGCWTEHSGDIAVDSIEGQAWQLDGTYQTRTEAIRKCYEAVKERGWRVFALRDGGKCGARADALYTYQKHRRSTNCGPDGEGGSSANQVYVIDGEYQNVVD